MLLSFLVINIIVATCADPLHKYPYVFLLDVGNEEIEGTNTEQIRVTIPGGSLALKYPATDTGDTIAHVRVSGVDFGTDLKADIAEGGPGYKYVVLVFMGNPGVPYDAVVTVETISDNSDQNNQNIDSNDSIDEANNSAEDTSGLDTKNDEPTNEIDASSSNNYKYENGDAKNNYQVNEDESNDEVNENEEADDENDETENEVQKYLLGADQNRFVEKKYEKYQAFRPQLYGGARIYPQASLYVEDNNFKPLYDPENHANDANIGNKYLDSNNNINTDYSISTDY